MGGSPAGDRGDSDAYMAQVRDGLAWHYKQY
jgi:hypothetical protein